MRRFAAFLTIIISVIITPLTSSALFGHNFKCKIKNLYDITEDGALKNYDAFIGQEFIVDRKTGIIIGDIFSNTDASKVMVISAGNVNTRFKSISIWNTLEVKDVQMLTIQQFYEDKKVMFIMHSGWFGMVFTGTCE